MAAQCADNSTECLLRALLLATQHQQDPWSSKNFAVTLVIGVAAAIISVVAVFQGLLAAGPGRIKAGPSAIGSFAKLTRGRISFTEFAYKSTARVPVITLYSLRSGLMRQSWFVEHGRNYPFDAGGMSTGATWLHLLKCTGLDEEVEQIFEGSLQECATDHLPSDIQAPTASIQLSCLAILAAIADPTVQFEKKDRFMRISGRISQISYRDNPILGTVAAYERVQTKYNSEHDTFLNEWKGMKPNLSLGRCTIFALDLAMGKLYVIWSMGVQRTQDTHYLRLMDFRGDETAYQAVKWSRADFDKRPHPVGRLDNLFAGSLILMYARTDYELRPFPWIRSKLSMDWFIKATEKYRQSLDVLESYLHPSGCHNDTGGAYDKRSPADDSVFELLGSWAPPHKDRLIDGTFGSNFCAGLLQAVDLVIAERQRSIKAGNVPDATNLVVNYERRVEGAIWNLKHLDILLRKWRFKAMDALDALTSRLCREAAAQPQLPTESIPTPPLSPSWSTASNISPTHPVAYLTSTPRSAPQNPHVSSTPRSSTSTAPSVGVRASLQFSGDSSSHLSRQTSHGSAGPPEQKTVSLQESLECLLIFRGFFLAALLEAGPDTSMLLTPSFRNEITKVM